MVVHLLSGLNGLNVKDEVYHVFFGRGLFRLKVFLLKGISAQGISAQGISARARLLVSDSRASCRYQRNTWKH